MLKMFRVLGTGLLAILFLIFCAPLGVSLRTLPQKF